MALAPKLEHRLSQSLVMTPQLRQAIKLLQFSNLELSEFVDQELEKNPLLEMALRLAQDTGAVGVCRAHSGTILGLLIDPHDTDMSYACDLARQRCPETVDIVGLSVIGGGPRSLPSETV